MAVTTAPTGQGKQARPGEDGVPAKLRRRASGGALPYLLLLPAILLELLVHIIPMGVGVFVSFLHLTEFYIRQWTSAPSAGLNNYRLAVNFNGPIGSALLHSFWVTLIYTLFVVGFAWLLGTAAAVLMQRQFRGRGALRTLFLVPYALPIYAAVITWAFMLQRDNGLVNHFFGSDLHLIGTGQSAPFWLIGANSFPAMVVVNVWRTWPFAFLIITAGLQNIPEDLYEATAIDGASWWRQLRTITMPMLRPVNQVLLLVLFLWTFNDFNTPFMLFGKSAPPQSDLISIHIYQNSFQTWNFGSGSAMSVLLMLFLLAVSGIYLFFTSRGDTRRDSHA